MAAARLPHFNSIAMMVHPAKYKLRVLAWADNPVIYVAPRAQHQNYLLNLTMMPTSM